MFTSLPKVLVRPIAPEQIKLIFLAKTQRREEKLWHDNRFFAPLRLCAFAPLRELYLLLLTEEKGSVTDLQTNQRHQDNPTVAYRPVTA
jgi:hypothetical protein